MLDRDRMDRMLNAASYADAAKLLVDCKYEDMSSLDSKLLDAVLKAGLYAPTAKNNQKPVMVAVRDKETRAVERKKRYIEHANNMMQYASESTMNQTFDPWEFKNSLNIKRVSGNVCICLACNDGKKFVVARTSDSAYANLKRRAESGVSPCPRCGAPIGFKATSQVEPELAKRYSTITIQDYRPSWMKGLELDLYDSENKIAIEYNGVKYHHDGTRPQMLHKHKADLCEANGVQLIQIYENEWVNSKEIVLDKLDAIFHVNMERKFARKLEIRELNDRPGRTLAGRFMDANHIQGAASCQWCVGLFEGEEPVAVCSFKYGTAYATGGQSAGTEKYWELNRYATKLHTSVVGGISRCVKAFARTHRDVHKIVSFADRRWTCPTRSAYASSGFVEVGRCEPNYMYTDLDPRHGLRSKQYMRKSSIEDRAKKNPDGPEAKVFDWGKTETEMSRELGFYRIYDAGKIRYEMSI